MAMAPQRGAHDLPPRPAVWAYLATFRKVAARCTLLAQLLS